MSDDLDLEERLLCIECRSELKPEAKKCIACGAYQDWRRFVWSYQNVIAILIALFALATALTTSGAEVKNTLSDWFSPPSPRVSAFITAFDDRALEFRTRNVGSSAFTVGGISCVLYVPQNKAELDRQWIENYLGESAEYDQKVADLFAGPFFAEFKPLRSLTLEPGEVAVMTAFFDQAQFSVREETEVSFASQLGCAISGFDEDMNSLGAIAPLSIQSMMNIDAMRLLEGTSFVGFDDQERTEFILEFEN